MNVWIEWMDGWTNRNLTLQAVVLNITCAASKIDHIPGTQDPGIPFPNNPELSSRSCTGLFSRSGPTVHRTARISNPSPVVAMDCLLRRWWKVDRCVSLGCSHTPCGISPPQSRMELVVRRVEGWPGGLQVYNTKRSKNSKFDLSFQSWKYIHQYRKIEHILFSKLLAWFITLRPMPRGPPFVLLPEPCECWKLGEGTMYSNPRLVIYCFYGDRVFEFGQWRGIVSLIHINFSVCQRDCYALHHRAIFNLKSRIHDNTRIFSVKENEGVSLDYRFKTSFLSIYMKRHGEFWEFSKLMNFLYFGLF